MNGPSGTLYTRNGSFQLSAGGQLTTSDGYAVLGAGGGPIQTQSQAPITVNEDGTLTQSDAPIGQLQIADFKIPRYSKKPGTITSAWAIRQSNRRRPRIHRRTGEDRGLERRPRGIRRAASWTHAPV